VCRERAITDALTLGNRLPVPTSIDRVPLVTGLDAVDLPLQFTGDRLAARIDQDQVEARRAVLIEGSVERRLDADHGTGRTQRPPEAALDGSRGAVYKCRQHLDLVRPRLERESVERQVRLEAAVGAGLQTRREGAQLAIHALVVTTEAVAGPARQAVSGRDAHLAAQRQVGGRGTEGMAGFQLQGRWCIEVDRAGSGKRRLEVHPLG